MPTNLSDVDSFPTATGPAGTDIRNAASVRDALQPLANRTRYLFNRSNPLADLTALKAVSTSGMAAGTTRFVTGHGAFTFDDTSALAESLPWVARPTDRPASNGRWIAASAHLTTRTVRIWLGDAITGQLLDIETTADVNTNNASTNVLLNGGVGWPYSPINDGFLRRNLGTLDIKAKPGVSNYQHYLFIPLDLPDGATVTSIAVRIRPAAVTTSPYAMPFVAVLKLVNNGTNRALPLLSTTNGCAVDVYTSAVAFNAEHSITFTPDQNSVVDKSNSRMEMIIGATNGSESHLDTWLYADVAMTIPDARGW
jgi:hypothetical protein